MAGRKGTSVGIEGGRELANKFRELSRNIENEMDQGLVNAALIVERSAKIKAPVDTGRLRSSITHRLIDTDGMPASEVGTDVEYAKHVEFGTSKQAAKPYLYPALSENKNKILKELAKAFKKGCGL